MHLIGPEPEGQSVAEIEGHEQHTVAEALGYAFLHTGIVRAVQKPSVTFQLDAFGAKGRHGADAAEDLCNSKKAPDYV